jgi:Fis family transcriptional regulator
VRESLQSYFRDLGGETPDGMYDMLVRRSKSRCWKW